MQDEFVTKNFTRSELECRCGCGAMPEMWAVKQLQEFRNLIKEPVYVNSAKRCTEHNKRVGGAIRSQHLLGLAFDIRIGKSKRLSALTIAEIVVTARDCGFAGFGVYGGFVHIDLRDYSDIRTNHPVFWSQDKPELIDLK